VYQTGTMHQEWGMHIPVAKYEGGPLEDFYLNYIQQARYDEHGHIDGVVVFGFDVTQQVRAQQASEASAQQLRLLTDALPVLISYVDRERRYQFTNEAYRAWFNQDPAALVGRPVREVVGEQAYAATQGYMTRVLAGERLAFDALMPYRPGFIKHIHTDYLPDVRQGEVVGFYTLVADVTAQVQAQEKVQELNEELQASNEELGETNQQLTRTNVDLDTFVYTASHDLKAPITNIEGILHALRETLPLVVQQDEVVTHLLSLLDQTVNRFLLTIEQLTDLSRLQQTYNEPAQRLALAPIVAGVLADLAPAIAAAAAQVELDVPADLHVSFAPASLRSIVYNLLSNAVKYRDPTRPAQVWLRAAQQAGGVELTVRDNGLGLSESQQERLFGAFQRLHTHVAGTGVGLYMIKRLIDNAGAKITVASILRVGSTFTVTFPA
jgi:PAS domain S-box-containing protein